MSKTIQEVVEFIITQVADAPLSDTVDTLKAGDPGWPVRGGRHYFYGYV